MIKELFKNKMVDKDHFSRNIERDMQRAIKASDSIYFYRIDPLTSESQEYDKLSWIREIRHEKFDKLKIRWYDGREIIYQSANPSDMVIKLNLNDDEIKRIFDEKFRIGTCWARGDYGCKIGKGNPLFDSNPGYEFYNFVLARKDEVILDAWLHGGFDIGISENFLKRENPK